jgi:hypothetical protein
MSINKSIKNNGHKIVSSRKAQMIGHLAFQSTRQDFSWFYSGSPDKYTACRKDPLRHLPQGVMQGYHVKDNAPTRFTDSHC